ncbi:hypothetical protein ABL78_0552 [Leptomonas seymouri]|uniref:Uncharacterized protein n=1 Tax=Leptomonas seymouri TaxID=5684 RepID=A0A0N1PGF9_LEPSE|nr:hypothetical protein ABL78_0552 [Leptomonas seymouri]|eukprot:KPI90325.1 hypothetical protein ABL78_0552 [Leptomonas seymouri]
MAQASADATLADKSEGSLGTDAGLCSSPPPSTASHNSRCSLSGRFRSSGTSSTARRRMRHTVGNTSKHYAPHICRFSPYRPPAAAVLDPFPNQRIYAICLVGLSTLVTVHRSGVRLYCERHLSPIVDTAATIPTSSPPSQGVGTLRSPSMPSTASTVTVAQGIRTASGVFEQLEARSDFQVRESYLCVAMPPLLVDGAAVPTKWGRYFCVASGNDRVVHSVSVMSSAAHFCLHHEKHKTNKVVCMHCTQIATEPFHPTVLRPAVLSVDEVGALVLFNVESGVSCLLEKAPLWFKRSDGRVKRENKVQQGRSKEDGAAEDGQPDPPRQTVLLRQPLSPEEEDHVVDAMERAPVEERATYHLDRGVATRVTLVGPCLELCNHCHNAFMNLPPSRGYIPVSVYVCSRAQDVPCDNTQQNDSAAAELNVTLLRVLWGPRRAFVLEEVSIVQEAAPTDVCEAGVTIAACPYEVGLPMTLLLARPALVLWRLRACTGERMDSSNLYPATGPSTDKGSCYSSLPRAASEFIIHWVPLGRHRLAMQSDDRIGSQSWLCAAAVTDDGTVLLIGRSPQAYTTPLIAAVEADAPVCLLFQSESAVPLRATEEEPEGFRDTDLEGWLDDINTVPAPSPPPAPLGEGMGSGRESRRAPVDNGRCSAHPYTVLMNLYRTGDSSNDGEAGRAGSSVAAGVLSVMPDLLYNRLILFMANEEALLTVPLPFAERMASLTDSDPVKGNREGSAGVGVQPLSKADTPAPSSAVRPRSRRDTATTATPGGSAVPGAAETATSSGYSQHLWGATSQVVRAASQGWSSSMLKWAPSSSPYFFPGSVSSHSRAAETATAAAPPGSLSKAEDESASQSNTVAPQTVISPPAPLEGERARQSRGAKETYHSFGIARPLMAVVFHFTGEGKEPPEHPAESMPPAATVRADDEKAKKRGEPQTRSASPLSPPASLLLRNGLASTTRSSYSDDMRSNSEASTAATSTSLAVPIRVINGDRDRRHRHHRRRLPSSASFQEDAEAGSCSGGGGGSHAGDCRRRRRRGAPSVESERASSCSPTAPPALPTGATGGGAAQASYVEAQMNLLAKVGVTRTAQEGPEAASADCAEDTAALRTCGDIQVELHHLVSVDEPLARNAILYSWSDGHNDFYIRLSAEQDALAQAATDAQHLPSNSSPPTSPRGHQATLQASTAIPTNTSADAAQGVHSVGFLSNYHSTVAWRAETSSYGNCFSFAEYFTTLQVPQHVLDMQERDKCRLELEDLRLQQARDMTAVHPYDLLTVWQNEERKSSEAAWKLHTTFPYDDERDGSVVDLNWLNRTAGSTQRTAAPAWRWATEKETRVWAEEEGKPQSEKRRVRSLVKELKNWSVGSWEYSERWPSRDDLRVGREAAAVWSSVETPAHRCRRRRLTRLRINVEELRRYTDLTESHIRELEALREELGL